MHRVLINNYNAQVPKDGVCYFLGDMGFSTQEALKGIMDQLNGIKVLLKGNHDKAMNSMYNVGFDVVLDSATIHVSNSKLTMSHCPLRGVFREDITGMRNAKEGENWHGESRHGEYSIVDEGQYHIHGHVHSGPHSVKLTKDQRQWDVGVVGNNYRPVSLSDVESWIARHKMSLK